MALLRQKQSLHAKEGFGLQRRLLIGVLASLGLGAFALVPLDALRGKPPKPLFYYLTPLVRVQVRSGRFKVMGEPMKGLAKLIGKPIKMTGRRAVENARGLRFQVVCYVCIEIYVL